MAALIAVATVLVAGPAATPVVNSPPARSIGWSRWRWGRPCCAYAVRPRPDLQLHLAYGLLPVLLGDGNAGIVPELGRLLGRDSSLVVAAATLAVTALFQPARRRIQQAVDRRFNRRRYDAAQTIAALDENVWLVNGMQGD